MWKKDQQPKGGWEGTIEACHAYPMARLDQIEAMIDSLNGRTAETNYEFHIQPVVDGTTPPNVAPHYRNGKKWQQPIKYEKTGPVVQAVLDSLPQSVRTGQDENCEVYQIRLNDLSSLENMMGTTTLLTIFLNLRYEGGNCYMFPDDPSSHQNWEVIKDMYGQNTPRLSE